MPLTPTNQPENLPEHANPGLPSRIVSDRLQRFGEQLIPGGHRTLLELAFKASAERVELEPGEYELFAGHDLARLYVAKAMRIVYQVIGVKPERYPEKQLAQTISRYVCRKYAHFTVEDVYEAFIQAVAGEIDVDVKHYGEVDLQYLDAVWKAYDRFAYPKVPPKPQAQLAQRTGSEARREHLKERRLNDEWIRRYLLEYYAQRLEGNPPELPVLAEPMWFLLKELGLAETTREEWETLMDQAAKYVASELNSGLKPSQAILLTTVENATRDRSQRVRAQAFRMLFSRTLANMERDGIELEHLRMEVSRVCYLDPSHHETLWHILQDEQPKTPANPA